MAERRSERRYTKRLKVRFGEADLKSTAFTKDVSQSGLFIMAQPALKVGTRLHLELVLSEKKSLFMECVVQRVVVSDPALRLLAKAGFGVRFLSREELAAEFLPQVGTQISVSYDSLEALKKGHTDQLSHGGVFVRLPKAPPLHSEVALQIQLPFAKLAFEFTAKVVNVTPTTGGSAVGLLFTDKQAVFAALAPLLAKVGG